MKLGCICGSYNRSFASGAMDQVRFIAHCADTLRVSGVEFQDIHFPRRVPPTSGRCARRPPTGGSRSSASGSTTTSAGGTRTSG